MGVPGSSLGKTKKYHLWKASARLTAIANTQTAAEKKMKALENKSIRNKSGAAVIRQGKVQSQGVFETGPKGTRQTKR